MKNEKFSKGEVLFMGAVMLFLIIGVVTFVFWVTDGVSNIIADEEKTYLTESPKCAVYGWRSDAYEIKPGERLRYKNMTVSEAENITAIVDYNFLDDGYYEELCRVEIKDSLGGKEELGWRGWGEYYEGKLLCDGDLYSEKGDGYFRYSKTFEANVTKPEPNKLQFLELDGEVIISNDNSFYWVSAFVPEWGCVDYD